MPFLPFPLPGNLSISAAGTGLYSLSGFRYDFAIGALPFMSAASREFPYMRETAPLRKEQFDSSNTPGEQSLSGWWLRSQTSFHGGAGQIFGDPQASTPTAATAAQALTRFATSRNVNVWTEGRAFLLNRAKKANPGGAIGNMADGTEFVYGDGTNAAMLVTASTVAVVFANSVTQSTFTATGQALQSVTTDGAYMFVVTSDGVYSAPIPASSAAAFTWTKIYTITGSPKCRMAFVKQRIMLGVGPSIYELPPHPGTPPAALPTPLYTNPDSAWSWQGFTETSGCIYAVGNNTVRGSILKFVLTNTGTIPTLSGGAVACQLPSGEVPYSAMGYLGQLVGIGTNKGVRVATSDSNGDLTYGPLLFTTHQPVMGWSARDRFLWFTASQGIDGDSGLCAIDLGNELGDLRFAYATDINYAGDASNCNLVCHLGSSDIKVYATAADIYIEDPTTLAATGYLRTSRMRFSTLEPKLYKLLRVRGPALTGPLAATILDQGDHESSSVSYALNQSPGDGDTTINSPAQPQDYVSLKFTLQKGAGATDGGEFSGYQLKALPAARRQRMIRLPALLYDFEQDASGNSRGAHGSAIDRLTALENLEADGNSVVLQDFDAGTTTSCVIEQISFTQSAPPSGFKGFGGVANVTLRTV